MHNTQVQREAWEAQVKLIIESQQHSCRTADEIFLDSRPLKASTSSQRCVLCTCVFMYLCICESSRCISPLEAVQSINFPLKMCPRLAEKLFGPNLNPFFLQQLKRSVFYSMQFKPFVVFHSILQHVVFHSILQHAVFHSILQLKLSVLYFTARESVAVRLASLDPNIDTQWRRLVQQGQKGACRILLFQFLLSPLYRSSLFHPFSPPRKHRSIAQQFANC